MTTEAPAKTILTVQRGLEVLRAFRSVRTPMSNSELVKRTGLPKATISRLTSTLLHLGFLRHVPGSRYFELGTGPLSIGHAFLESSLVGHIVQPFMQRLADKLNVSVALAIGDHLEMLYIGYCTGQRIATLRLGVGSLLPMGTTAVGRAYLYGLPAVEQSALISALRRAAGQNGGGVEAGIRAGFSELQSTGTCFAVSGFQRDAYGIALPVHIGRSGVLMSFSCGAVDVEPYRAAARKRNAPKLIEAASQLTRLLADIDGCP